MGPRRKDRLHDAVLPREGSVRRVFGERLALCVRRAASRIQELLVVDEAAVVFVLAVPRFRREELGEAFDLSRARVLDGLEAVIPVRGTDVLATAEELATGGV